MINVVWFEEQFGSEECALQFSQLLRRLGEPPMVTTLRMNLLRATPDLILQKLKAVLTEVGQHCRHCELIPRKSSAG